MTSNSVSATLRYPLHFKLIDQPRPQSCIITPSVLEFRSRRWPGWHRALPLGRFRSVSRASSGSSGWEEQPETKKKDAVEVDDALLQDAIDKSKKVLQLQNSLLQKIAERRELVTSFTREIANSGGEDSASSATDDGKKTAADLDGFYSNIASFATNPAEFVGKAGEENDAEEVDFSVPPEFAADAAEKNVVDDLEQAVIAEDFVVNGASSDNAADRAAVAEEDVAHDARVEGVEKGTDGSGPLAGENVMNVILAVAECTPWCKTGGLADVAGSLPKALARRGHRVMVVLPRYGNYAEPQEVGVRKYYKVAGQDHEVNFFHAYIDGVDFVFVDSPVFRNREKDIYGGQRTDVLKRMILFCKVAVEVPWHVPCGGICYGDGNLVFIANDWHTALLPVYLKTYYRDNGLMKYTRSVLVIHNIAFQGRGPEDDFEYYDLPEHHQDLFKLYDPVTGDHCNIFAAGLKTADRVVTVSPAYAWELRTVEGGWGLHNIINENNWKLHGIVNGIDTDDWNPERDIHLSSDGYANYSLETLGTGKAQCKAALQREFGLVVCPETPIIGFIGRLDYQKGIDIIADAMPWINSQNVQLVMLGTGRSDLENMLRNFENQYRDKVRGFVGFSVEMAHRITAGADILLMPSRFEPCGLNQLYAMRYGTIPVVHAVGGLRDTVVPYDPMRNAGYGWTFDRAEANRLIDALGHCLNTYRNYPESWSALQRRGMSQDLSWDHAAELYEKVLVAAKFQW